MPDAYSVTKRDGLKGCTVILTNSEKVGLVVRVSLLPPVHYLTPFMLQFIVLCSFLSLAAVVTVLGLYSVRAQYVPTSRAPSIA